MSSNAEKLLHTRLASNPLVSGLVASRVYPVIAPQNAALPYIVYSRNSTQNVNSASGYSGSAIAQITVSSWAKTYSGAKALADAVRAALNGWRDQGASPKIDLASIVDESDDLLAPEDGNELPEAYGVVHTIDLSFEES